MLSALSRPPYGDVLAACAPREQTMNYDALSKQRRGDSSSDTAARVHEEGSRIQPSEAGWLECAAGFQTSAKSLDATMSGRDNVAERSNNNCQLVARSPVFEGRVVRLVIHGRQRMDFRPGNSDDIYFLDKTLVTRPSPPTSPLFFFFK